MIFVGYTINHVSRIYRRNGRDVVLHEYIIALSLQQYNWWQQILEHTDYNREKEETRVSIAEVQPPLLQKSQWIDSIQILHE